MAGSDAGTLVDRQPRGARSIKHRGLFYLQVAITSLTALFMIVPVLLSMLAGVTQNYFCRPAQRPDAEMGGAGVADVCRHLLVVAADRPVLAVMQAIQLPRLEEAAASLGAGFWRRFFTVVVPNCRNGILAGTFMVIILSVGLADSYASMRLEVGSAYTLIFILMILPLLLNACNHWLERQSRRQQSEERA